MTTNKPLILLSIMISTLLLLSACGDDESATASAPAAAPMAESAPAASNDSMGSSMDFEKAEGVVYQDEIYANWPYN